MIRLNDAQMAHFVARGFLELEAVVPDAINLALMQELTPLDDESPSQLRRRLIASGTVPAIAPGTPLADAYTEGSAIARMVQVPEVAGAIASLVGERCVLDHHYLHSTTPGGTAQHTHADSTIDIRRTFDIQLFYFPHDTLETMGGTRYVPGTHLRIINEMAIARYQNLAGQRRIVCPAGTVVLFHHGLWHGAGANRSTRLRQVLKLRLCPTEPQRRLWNLGDAATRTRAAPPIFWTDPDADRDAVHRILMTPEPWFEQDTGRLEYLNRIRLWRHLLGDEHVDVDYWMTRIENERVVAGTR